MKRTLIIVVVAMCAVQNTISSAAHQGRNRAGEIVRGGTWLYNTRPDPCGSDRARSTCGFGSSSGRHRHLQAENTVKLDVSDKEIKHLDRVSVKINFRDYKPNENDWVGAYCVDDEASPLDDSQYLDYQYVNDNKLMFGPLVNMRCSWQFRYFTQEAESVYQKLGTSPYVVFKQGAEEPLHIHVAKTEREGEMRVMWVSSPVLKPIVKYGTNPHRIRRRVGAVRQVDGTPGDTYKASDMCEAPATTERANLFRDPGVMYSAIIKALDPDSTYYYQVCGGEGAPCSGVMKFHTPPAPDDQDGTASFFVYGDLGDWNIFATGELPAKRSGTTMQLVRRDMDTKGSNYVAVMHVGDLSYGKGSTYLWDQFGALIEPVASEIPYMVTVGNHEYCYTSGGENDPSGAGETNGFHPDEGNYAQDSQGECGVPTNKRFLMPANGNNVFWWSTEIGLMHHTMISSEHDYTPGSVMYKWLEEDLMSVDRAKTPWLFLHLHRPMYTSEEYESDHKVSLLIRKNLEPLLAKYRVDAVFSGHYHAYELTCPVYDDACRTEKLENGLEKALAPVHIMVGSAGADVDNVGYYDVPWRVDAKLEYGYGRVHVYNASHAQFEFVQNADGKVGSSAWIISDHDWNVA